MFSCACAVHGGCRCIPPLAALDSLACKIVFFFLFSLSTLRRTLSLQTHRLTPAETHSDQHALLLSCCPRVVLMVVFGFVLLRGMTMLLLVRGQCDHHIWLSNVETHVFFTSPPPPPHTLTLDTWTMARGSKMERTVLDEGAYVAPRLVASRDSYLNVDGSSE